MPQWGFQVSKCATTPAGGSEQIHRSTGGKAHTTTDSHVVVLVNAAASAAAARKLRACVCAAVVISAVPEELTARFRAAALPLLLLQHSQRTVPV